VRVLSLTRLGSHFLFLKSKSNKFDAITRGKNKECPLTEYESLRSRIGKERADYAVAMGWIESPRELVEKQSLFLLPESILSVDKVLKPDRVEQNSKRTQFGQFMTPMRIAQFMAGLFRNNSNGAVRLLDAGAGQGSLTLAFLDRWKQNNSKYQVESTCYEIDPEMLDQLTKNLATVQIGCNFKHELICDDFVEQASRMIQLGRGKRFTHAILNPPYKKINSNSSHRAFLRDAGLETVNLYTGFVGLSVALMEKGGEIVAIIPRSFCNGPYYQPFRQFILARAAIQHIHLFETRNMAFKGDGVLQENIIIRLVCAEKQGEVAVSTSTDDTFSDYAETIHTFDNIVSPSDDQRFIHIPTSEDSYLLKSPAFRYRLDEVGLTVSTGPVVDFRMLDDLCADPEPDSVPLLYPGHFGSKGLEWPKPNFKKANAVRYTPETKKWLFPLGFYAVVRRFSSKEERRRIVANVVDPASFNSEMIGFENHLNVLHDRKRPLCKEMAHGIAVFLNSSVVDQYFRRFNGHTQVNATDLRNMRYPSRSALLALGEWARQLPCLTQNAIDARVAELA
jgi:adenine-specific DNA-methyltransferase